MPAYHTNLQVTWRGFILLEPKRHKRTSRFATPVSARRRSNTGKAKCCAHKSAGLRSPQTLFSVDAPVLKWAYTQSWPTAKCLTRPFPFQRAVPRCCTAVCVYRQRPYPCDFDVPWRPIFSPVRTQKWRSCKYTRSELTAFLLPLFTDLNFFLHICQFFTNLLSVSSGTSAIDSTRCRLAGHMAPCKVRAHMDAEARVSLCHGKRHTKRGESTRYWANRRRASTSASVGQLILLLRRECYITVRTRSMCAKQPDLLPSKW